MKKQEDKQENKLENLSYVLPKLLEICNFLTGSVSMAPIIQHLKSISDSTEFSVAIDQLRSIERKLVNLPQPTMGRKQLVTEFSSVIDLYENANSIATKVNQSDDVKIVDGKLAVDEFINAANIEGSEEFNEDDKMLEKAKELEQFENEEEEKRLFAAETDMIEDQQPEPSNEEKQEALDQLNKEADEQFNSEMQEEETEAINVGEKLKLTKTMLKKLPADFVKEHELTAGDFIFVISSNNLLTATQRKDETDVTVLMSDEQFIFEK